MYQTFPYKKGQRSWVDSENNNHVCITFKLKTYNETVLKNNNSSKNHIIVSIRKSLFSIFMMNSFTIIKHSICILPGEMFYSYLVFNVCKTCLCILGNNSGYSWLLLSTRVYYSAAQPVAYDLLVALRLIPGRSPQSSIFRAWRVLEVFSCPILSGVIIVLKK